MKIHFDNVDFMVRSGPNTFANRLAAQLTQDGHTVQRTSDGADVSLVFIQPSGAPLAKKVVQRLDGIWFKPELFWQNAPIQNLYRRAQGVIVQSQFDFKMIENWFGVRGNMFQIPNGISKTTIPTSRLQQIKQDIKNGADADYLFVSSANWHNQKRLASNIALYRRLNEHLNNKALMIVFGNLPSTSYYDDLVKQNRDIAFCGSRPVEQCLEIYAVANAMIHLAWLDHCPNTVVESLSQGCPVICASSGGTRELVGDHGLVIEDAPYNFELMDYDDPLVINLDVAVEKIVASGLLNRENLTSTPSICDISEIAKRYIYVLKRAVNTT